MNHLSMSRQLGKQGDIPCAKGVCIFTQKRAFIISQLGFLISLKCPLGDSSLKTLIIDAYYTWPADTRFLHLSQEGRLPLCAVKYLHLIPLNPNNTPLPIPILQFAAPFESKKIAFRNLKKVVLFSLAFKFPTSIICTLTNTFSIKYIMYRHPVLSIQNIQNLSHAFHLTISELHAET